MLIEDIKKEIINLVKQAISSLNDLEINLGFPPSIDLGDFTLECFQIAKKLKKSPVEIAKEIKQNFPINKLIQEIKVTGPYVNFKIHNNILFKSLCLNILEQEDNFGKISKSQIKSQIKTMVEYLSPNTNKPLHLGHLRNGCLGMGISNLLESIGHHLVKAILINDRGVHICKSMLAWQLWGNNKTPEQEGLKGDHFVGKYYVRYSQEADKETSLEEKAQQMLQKWESGDKDIICLWEKMNSWVYEGFEETYRKIGLKFDVFYYESNTYKLGKEIIKENLKNQEKQIFFKDAKGNIIFNLPMEDFGVEQNKDSKKITVLRPDGTSVYITQDLGTAVLKATGHNLDNSIYVVGSEQDYYFKCLFAILKALKYDWAEGYKHLSYGMVYLPDGKMKSREGKVVDADELICEMEKLAEEEIRKRLVNTALALSDIEIKQRAYKIAIGAIKFYLLKVNPSQNIYFDPKESISFDGFTGPYCQYAYARIYGILENISLIYPDFYKALINNNLNDENIVNLDLSGLGNKEELLLIKKLIDFKDEIKNSAEKLNPSGIAIYVFDLAKAFNQFYNKHKVINLDIDKENLTKARLLLIKAVSIVLKNALNLLGIDVLENM